MYGGRPRSHGFRGGYQKRQSSQYRRPSRPQVSASRYIKRAEEVVAEAPYQSIHTFSDFGLDPKLLANVIGRGYAMPTQIQDQAIPALMAGKDVVGIANTGTGKTVAFLLPLINQVLLDQKQGVLILAPTRELALQIVEEFRVFAKGLPISSCLCIGGMNITPQMQRLRDNPHFVIGTPGRIKDLIQRNAFNTSMFTNIVLDEVDRMLDIGFRQDIKFLISKLPEKRHSAFFSATMNGETDSIARNFLRNPEMITVSKKENSKNIDQDVIHILPGQNKIDVLHELLLQEDFKKVMVFGRTKHGINKLEEVLIQRGLKVSSIHGNKNQNARERALRAFKQGYVQALLATDIVARGIDVEDVTHVINFDEPETYDDYIHRIGRTGRAGKTGKALTFI